MKTRHRKPSSLTVVIAVFAAACLLAAIGNIIHKPYTTNSRLISTTPILNQE